jgi:2-methylcitrate dehydratase PrpD
MEIVRYLANLVHQINKCLLLEEDQFIVRQHLLDAIASAFFGMRNKVFESFTQLTSKTPDDCHWLRGGLGKYNLLDNAMFWAFSINASVFEDGSREGACHPSAAVFPVIITLSKGKSWEILDKAAIAGYDVMVRLARGGNPEFTKKGFHPTAITAAFGAAATASSVLGYDITTTQNSLCLAALGCSGLMASFREGETQPLQVAWSVRNGLYAALIAGMGHKGYDRIIEEGFYPAYLGKSPYPYIDEPLERKYAIENCYLKPYPGCRHVHPSIDALSRILDANRINPADINRIKVRTYKIALETEIHTLNKRGDAYFSIPYALAARLVLGRNDWDAYDEKHFSNKQIINIMRKVSLELDQEIDERYPKERGSIVEIETVDGKSFREKVRYAIGEPENPIPFAATIKKFNLAAISFLSKEQIDRLERMGDVRGLSESPEILFGTLSEDRTQSLEGDRNGKRKMGRTFSY